LLFVAWRHQGVYIVFPSNLLTSPQQGHLLWNAGRTLATYLETNADSLIRGKTVLELGAGAGLPSLVSAIHGAKQVVVTDYPDPDLVENLQWNVDHCAMLPQPRNIEAKGYLWGAETETVVSGLSSGEASFDLLILADLLFNHSEHRKLLSSVQQMLKRSADAQALVFFTPYRPWLLQNDLAFFDLAKEAGFVVEKFFEHTMEKVMFEEDPGVSTRLSTDDVRVRDANCIIG
jgi:nicotinamide N-methyltransferase